MKRLLLIGLTICVFLPASATGDVPESPFPVSPGSTSTVLFVETPCPTFSWGGVSDATAYELVVYRVDADSRSTEPVGRWRFPGLVGSWTPSAEECLERNTRYAWSVRALRGDGESIWSEANVFRVRAEPSIQEVRQALALLSDFLERGSAPHALDIEPRPMIVPEQSQAPQEVPAANHRAVLSGGALQNAPEPLSAPTLGAASLTVDQQIHLGLDSSFFLGGELFLWGQTGVSGRQNTALGGGALGSLSASPYTNDNTAIGFRALAMHVQGYGNTAVGSGALINNTRTAAYYGSRNTAVGTSSLYRSTGNENVAVGTNAMRNNTTGRFNTAVGARALLGKTTAGYLTSDENVAVGVEALKNLSIGAANVAIGRSALEANSSGASNIAIGKEAGINITSGSNNILIGHLGVASDPGPPIVPEDDGVIRIGTSQGRTFLAGVSGKMVDDATDAQVLVDAAGQLGTVASSRRFKHEIRAIGDRGRKLQELRPVSFRYLRASGDSEGTLRFGLIAEEVEEVFPELVIHDPDGRSMSVKYHLLSPLLLSELQRQQRQIELLQRGGESRRAQWLALLVLGSVGLVSARFFKRPSKTLFSRP